MESNERLELAYRIIEKTGSSLFLTGKAGTGKTTFLRNLRARSRKRMVVCAPTGIAAINAGGMTLHSFFQLDFGPFVPGAAPNHSARGKFKFGKDKLRIIRGMDLLVIDEVSMVRADLLDAVDDVLRRLRDRTRPFGGVQLLLIGDLQQLAPVAREEEMRILGDRYDSLFFFDSLALKQVRYETVELDEVFRQKDASFLEMLNAIRENRADASVLARLNRRVVPGFNPPMEEGYIRLTTHNAAANDINDRMMDGIDAPEFTFRCMVNGHFPETSFPADENLRLKVGAQVMFIKNDSGADREYYNGMLGTVVAIDEEEGVAVMPQEGGSIIHVHPAEWTNVKYAVNPETNEIEEKVEGSFTQYPLRPAWAVTIHKSQGLTFDRAIIDVTRSFAHGQTYVALSRCRSLEGLVLEKPIPPRAIISDSTVRYFLETHNCAAIDEQMLRKLENEYRVTMLDDMFNFRQLFAAMEGVVRVYKENFGRRYPEMVRQWSEVYENTRREVTEVADKFRLQYSRLAMEGSVSEERLQERVRAAAGYFLGALSPVYRISVSALRESDNKSVRFKLAERLELFEDLLTAKRLLLHAFRGRDFNPEAYLDIKAQAMLRGVEAAKSKRAKSNVKLREPKRPAPVPEKEPAESEEKAERKQKKAKEKNVVELKAPNIPSWQISIDMFNAGKSPGEIARERGILESTVRAHVTEHLDEDAIRRNIDRFVRPEVRGMLQKYMDENRVVTESLTDIRESMGSVPEYDEIRIMMRINHCERRVPQIANEPEASYGAPDDFLD